jgi:acyl-coenzyme A synthetase/AMP-(fatty) acid ligase/pimeloyl-ACP methyl ester carboxylesterase
LVSAADSQGVTRSWHVLDNCAPDAELTLLCVHGNPTWSYLWRSILAQAPPGIRVIAIDHLDMGYSERTGTVRRLAQRIDDLDALVGALNVVGQVVTVAHDWGGPISLGWASRNQDRLAGIALMNTAVHQPPGSPAPTLIRIARSRPLLSLLAMRTAGFVKGTLALARPRLPKPVRHAFRAPYRSADRRSAIAAFVADIPLEAHHPSMAALEDVVAGAGNLADTPALLLWGSSDPVFSDLYLRDLQTRFRNADVHRYGKVGHLLPEDVDIATPLYDWLATIHTPRPAVAAPQERPDLWAQIERRQRSDEPAVTEMDGADPARTITWAELAAEIERVGAGLAEHGVGKGDRVSLLVPPGIDLTVCLYACWRIGAVAVIVDAGLGAKGMTQALRSAAPDYLIGVSKALAAARLLRWPGKRFSTDNLNSARRISLGVTASLADVRDAGDGRSLPTPPTADDVAVVVFTSGATGPAKGVVYRHGQAQAQRDALMQLYAITESDRLVAAFAPFALYGAAMGIPSVVPDMEVTAPRTLTAAALAGAAVAIDATMIFASPAALVNVDRTGEDLTPRMRSALLRVRILMSAGAPVPAELLRRVADLVPRAELHTPYGMTEVLPVADISLAEIEDAGIGNGVCVGYPIDSVAVSISPLDGFGAAVHELTTEPGVSGEICIQAPHARDHYDKLWATSAAASQPAGWHRSGDIGHLDEAGRLWVEGRMVHIITTAGGVVTPVGLEHAAESVDGISQAAAVGVGPADTQQVVLVVVTEEERRRAGAASRDLADAVRDLVGVDVAAVLVVPALPVDKRHNSKINRTRVAAWAERVLAGGKVGLP